MFSLGGNQRIYYCAHPVNLRKSFDGLAGAVQEYIGRDPASGHLFVFFSRNKKLVKMLFYQSRVFSPTSHVLALVFGQLTHALKFQALSRLFRVSFVITLRFDP